MLVLILGLSVLTYVVVFLFIILSVRNKALVEGKKTATLVAEKKANEIKAIIDEDLAVSRILAEAVEDMTYLPDRERNERRKELLDRALVQYPKYDATWMSWQLELIDSTWTESYGRERFNSYFDNGEVKSSIERAELDGRKASSIYEAFKADLDLQEMLSDPYWFLDYDYSSNTQDSLLAISTVTTLQVDGKFAGVVGADMSVDAFQGIAEVDNYTNAYAVLISNAGIITAYKDPLLFNSAIDSLSIFNLDGVDLKSSLSKGESMGYTIHDPTLDETVYVHLTPVPIGRTGTYWSVATVVPVEEIMAPFNQTFRSALFVLIISLLILAGFIFYMANTISLPIKKATRLLEQLAKGSLDSGSKLEISGTDELGKIAVSVNELMDALRIKSRFAQKIGEGNLDVKLDVSSSDVLGNALVDMQRSLKSAIGDIKSLIDASEDISDNVVNQAQNINQTASEGNTTSENGINLVRNMSQGMQDISSIAQETKSSFGVLEKRSSEISNAVNVITDLSRQTNLLAINAAIEASQSGEAGKGFAVVAREIRKLAESSGKSAQNITDIVEQIQNDIQRASDLIKRMSESIMKGEAAADDTSAAFKQINASVSETLLLSESILSVAQQQIEKIREVSQNTDSMVK